MASRCLAAAAAAARTSPSPFARLLSRPGLAGPAGRYWPEKVNLREDPMNPMRWKASRGFSTGQPAGKTGSGMRLWWHRATDPIHRIKSRMETADLEERARALYVYLIFTLGTSTVYWMKTAKDIYYRV